MVFNGIKFFEYKFDQFNMVVYIFLKDVVVYGFVQQNGKVFI